MCLFRTFEREKLCPEKDLKPSFESRLNFFMRGVCEGHFQNPRPRKKKIRFCLSMAITPPPRPPLPAPALPRRPGASARRPPARSHPSAPAPARLRRPFPPAL
jgi:hypothetical protein